MASPKHKKSKMRKRQRVAQLEADSRAGCHLPELRRRRAFAPCVPEVRHVQGSQDPCRRRVINLDFFLMTKIALDAMGATTPLAKSSSVPLSRRSA